MEEIGIKLQKAVLIMMSIVSMSGMSSCEDRLDSPCPSTGGGKTVEVSLSVGIADEDDAARLTGNPVSSKVSGMTSGFGFNVSLGSTEITKAISVEFAKPDKLYGLQIVQYKFGSYDTAPIGKIDLSSSDLEIGSSFTGELSDNDGDYCQLLVVARGKNTVGTFTVGSLMGKKLSDIQKDTASVSMIEAITPEAYAANSNVINAMPYVLHLPKVRLVNDGGTYKIQSPDGEDVRILLRRLAVRLTLSWKNKYVSKGYKMNQILLKSIPSVYKIIPTPNENDGYPSLMDQYRTIMLPELAVKDEGSYSCWVPAVVRGKSAKATSDYYRTKENAPKGSAYATFVTQDTSDGKKKLNYRVYLGGPSSHDFDLYDNTNYIYNVMMSHTSLPVDDRRVTIIDPIPASENNGNFVPTSNCFMVAPGGAFCFNPYTYYVNGSSVPNETLQDWCGVSGETLTKPIKSVKVLWQTLEDGDLGDPVLGAVNTYAPLTPDDDHTNIVDLKRGESLADARIYCRVTPNTSGGNGVIAGYSGENGTGDILWSWHVWVTDYAPSSIGSETVLEENRRKLVYKQGSNTRLPMMDRNLGAVAGYDTVPNKELERSKANGLMYQWGRKDPYRSSYTNSVIPDIPVSETIESPMDGLLSCYRGDGITFAMISFDYSTRVSYQTAYQKPEVMYKPGKSDLWSSNRDSTYIYSWGMGGDKGAHDPCPSGWRVCAKEDFYPLYSAWGSGSLNLVGDKNGVNAGGYLISYDDTNRSRGSYYRLPGYWMGNSFGQIGQFGYYWTRDIKGTDLDGHGGYPLRLKSNKTAWEMTVGGYEKEALLIRCIQERAN